MRAMILAAGLGTRLRPLTLVRPKVLVPLVGTRVLDFWIRQLHKSGVEAVVLNAFHLSQELIRSVRGTTWPIPVEVREEPLLLDTAGGIRNALDFFGNEPFAVINGDILCDAPLQDLYQSHLTSKSPVSLLLHDIPDFNNVAVDSEGRILGFGKEVTRLASDDRKIQLRAFTGIHFMHPGILETLPKGQPAGILDVYRRLIGEGRPPQALYHSKLYWREMGSVERYRRLIEELSLLPRGFLPPLRTGRPIWVHRQAHVAPDVCLRGFVSIGAGCRVENGAELENTILWRNVLVHAGSVLRNCILADHATVRGFHEDKIFAEPTE